MALGKAGLSPQEVDFILAGDLLNQCISSTFGLLDFGIPFLGQYGACSTMAQNAAAGLHSGGERRCGKGPGGDKLPLLLGRAPVPPAFGVRRPARPLLPSGPPTAAGCALVGLGGKVRVGPGPGGRHPGFGREGPPPTWGAAMAPAAGRQPVPVPPGHRHLPRGTTTASSPGIWARWAPSCCTSAWRTTMWTCAPFHQDCGLLLYDRQRQDVHAGGSGCGCSASVLCGTPSPPHGARGAAEYPFLRHRGF